MSEDIEAITKSVIAQAKSGDVQAARLVLDRICPARKGSVVTFKTGGGRDAESIAETFANLVNALSKGEVSPEEASSIANVLSQQIKIVEIAEMEERLRLVEQQLQGRPPLRVV
jgi:hypothetical protein